MLVAEDADRMSDDRNYAGDRQWGRGQTFTSCLRIAEARGNFPCRHDGTYRFRDLDKLQLMPRPLTADDIMPLVASLTESERIKLLRWIASPHGTESSAYRAAPPGRDEFSGDGEPLAGEADGWDELN
jgi:hypothetical protein